MVGRADGVKKMMEPSSGGGKLNTGGSSDLRGSQSKNPHEHTRNCAKLLLEWLLLLFKVHMVDRQRKCAIRIT